MVAKLMYVDRYLWRGNIRQPAGVAGDILCHDLDNGYVCIHI